VNTIEEIIADIREGKMVVILDDEDRENEGDLIMAASKVRPEDINFMAHKARGLICLSLERSRCEQLKLPLMVSQNHGRFSTNFTVSIEAAEGVTTGISAFDRAHTIRTAVKPDAAPEDITQPGHIFPLMARPGGVLTRAGHTETGVDLARLADLEPAAVLVEILNDDGSMARRPELEAFAKEHDLKIGTVADLIGYRLRTEKTVERIRHEPVSTAFGEFDLHVYRDIITGEQHTALVRGEPAKADAPLVRVHARNMLSDVLMIEREDFGLPLRTAMQRIAMEEHGVIVVLGQNESNDEMMQKLLRQKPDAGKGGSSHSDEWRTVGIGAQILRDLGVRRMRAMSTPRRFTGLAGFGLEIVAYETADAEHPLQGVSHA
jgi:3,4-dihydroxy 2-butanone 4-phosphate synthase/GTP cyclohydrolase II